MKRLIMLACLIFTVLTYSACYAEKSRIYLLDGSIVDGEITSMNKGIYTLRAAGAQEMQIESTKIIKIETLTAGSAQKNNTTPSVNTTPSSKTDMDTQIDNMQAKIMSNPETISSVMGLTQDPQFQQLLSDPEIFAAVQAKDTQTLMGNEKFMSFISTPKFQEISNKVKEQNQ